MCIGFETRQNLTHFKIGSESPPGLGPGLGPGTTMSAWWLDCCPRGLARLSLKRRRGIPFLWAHPVREGPQGSGAKSFRWQPKAGTLTVRLLAAEAGSRDVDPQCSLDQFAAECEAARIKISTSKSEAMVLIRKKVECLLWVGEEILLQVEKFKYLQRGKWSRRSVLCAGRPLWRASWVKRQAFDLLVDLCSYSHLWPWSFG